MKKKLLVQLISLLSFTAFSQDASFFKEYGEIGVSESGTGIAQLASGSIFISGGESDDIGDSHDIFVLKLDKNGEVLDKWFYGTEKHEYPNSLQLVDNELVMVGEVSNLEGTKKTGFVLKIDTSGNQLFYKTYEKQDVNLVFSDGYYDGKNYLVTGFISGEGFGNDVYVAQISENPDENWEYIFGDTLNEVGNSIKEFPNGNIIVTCDNQRVSWEYNVLSLCFDKKGNLVWEKDIPTQYNGGSKKMLINDAGNAFMFGEMSTSTSFYFDMYFVEVSPDGDLVRSGWIPGADDHSEAAFGGCEIIPGNYLLTGFGYNADTEDGDIPVISIDASGKVLEQKFYGKIQFQIGYAIIPAISGGFLMTGNSTTGGDLQVVLVHDQISTLSNTSDIISSKKAIVKSVFKNGNEINVRLNNFFDLDEVQLLDMGGNSVFRENINSKISELSFLKRLSSGVYVLKFKFDNGEVKTEKVFIF